MWPTQRVARLVRSRLRLRVAAWGYRWDRQPGPLVTVVVPVWNEERFLPQALRSIAEQSYPNLECVIVDDHSTDATREIAARFCTEDPRFRLLSHDRNRGLSASRNSGLAEAKGPYIVFLDGDDALLPHAIRHRVDAMQGLDDDAVAGVISRIIQVPEDATLEAIRRHQYDLEEQTRRVDFITAQGDCPFNVHALLARVDVLRRFGGFDESMRHGAEDWDLWQRLMRHGYAFVTTGTLGGLYRQKRGSMVRSMPIAHLEEGLRLIRAAATPLPEAQILPGTPFVFREPLADYARKLTEARRVIPFATFCQLNGDDAGRQAALAKLDPGSHAYLSHHLDIDALILDALARYHCVSPSDPALQSDTSQRQLAEMRQHLARAIG